MNNHFFFFCHHKQCFDKHLCRSSLYARASISLEVEFFSWAGFNTYIGYLLFTFLSKDVKEGS